MNSYILSVECGGRTFNIQPNQVREWKPLLDCADSFVVMDADRPIIRIQLGGTRRWIVYQDSVSGSPVLAVGYQESVGALRKGPNVYVGGSSRKVLCWLLPDGPVTVGPYLEGQDDDL